MVFGIEYIINYIQRYDGWKAVNLLPLLLLSTVRVSRRQNRVVYVGMTLEN